VIAVLFFVARPAHEQQHGYHYAPTVCTVEALYNFRTHKIYKAYNTDKIPDPVPTQPVTTWVYKPEAANTVWNS
jgi:hypothetical protein